MKKNTPLIIKYMSRVQQHMSRMKIAEKQHEEMVQNIKRAKRSGWKKPSPYDDHSSQAEWDSYCRTRLASENAHWQEYITQWVEYIEKQKSFIADEFYHLHMLKISLDKREADLSKKERQVKAKPNPPKAILSGSTPKKGLLMPPGMKRMT